MGKQVKNIIIDWIPPIFIRKIKQVFRLGNRFEGDFSTWQKASEKCDGYSKVEILDKVLSSTLKVKRNEAVYERDSVLFDKIEYSWPVLSSLMWVAAKNNGRLNVLDFGGSLGSSYFQNYTFLKSLPELCWNIVEQPHYVEAGIRNIQNDTLKFFSTIDECMDENQPNVILLSSVLQYIDEPLELLNKLYNLKIDYLIIDRTPFSLYKKDKLLIQKVPASIYKASYPMWILSKSKHLSNIEKHWKIVIEYENPEIYSQTTTGFKFEFQGMLLEVLK